jgi:alpha-L-fucosidase
MQIVDLLTEVVAKGGNLLLNVGPASDGTIPELQAAPLREAGTWIRRFEWLLRDSQTWSTWGDRHVRYLTGGHQLYAIDVGGRHEFEAIDPRRHRVLSVEKVGDGAADVTTVGFSQDGDGLHLDLPRATRTRHERDPIDVPVYRITLEPVEAPIELFAPTPTAPTDLAPILAQARPGQIVHLGDGHYTGPANIPDRVTVRGIGPGRTTIDGGIATAVELGQGSRLEHVSVTGGGDRLAWFPVPTVRLAGSLSTVLGCEIRGHVVIAGDDVVVRATTASGVVAHGAQRATLSRCDFRGMRWDVGIDLVGGDGHEIDSCDLQGHLCAIRVTDATGVVIRGNTMSGRWWAIRLVGSERAHVHGNTIHHSMRAIDLDGGSSTLIDGNAVFDGDSGCIVQNGASGMQVSGNHWERCRIGMLAWNTTSLHHQDNSCVDLHEPEHAFQFGS